MPLTSLAQAEHDKAAQSILMTDDESLAEAVNDAVSRQLRTLPRADVAGASWEVYGAIIILDHLAMAPALADRYRGRTSGNHDGKCRRTGCLHPPCRCDFPRRAYA